MYKHIKIYLIANNSIFISRQEKKSCAIVIHDFQCRHIFLFSSAPFNFSSSSSSSSSSFFASFYILYFFYFLHLCLCKIPVSLLYKEMLTSVINSSVYVHTYIYALLIDSDFHYFVINHIEKRVKYFKKYIFSGD